jgi:DNA-binding LacI/PurR family transcriptional regulator
LWETQKQEYSAVAANTSVKLREDKIYNFGSGDLDESSSLYMKIADELIQEVTSGPGSELLLLPQERDLAAKFKVSRSTIRQALTLLEQYDLVQRRRGHGTVLTKPADETLHVWRLRNKHLLVFQFSATPVRYNVDYYGKIIAGIVAEARHNRQSLEVKYPYYPGEVPQTLHELPNRERIAGVIVSGMFDDSFLKLFSDNQIPCVCVDYWPHDNATDAVTVDVEADAYVIAAHLSQLGYRTIGMAAFGRHKRGEEIVRFDPDVWRFLGHLRRAAGQFGLLIRDEWITTVPGNDQIAQQAIDRFFMLEQLPETLICFDRTVAVRAMEALRRRGIDCPAKMGLISRSDGRANRGRLTTLECRPEEMGRAALRLLLDRIYRRRTFPTRVAVSSYLVVGETTRLKTES